MKKSTLFGSAVLVVVFLVHLGGCDGEWGKRETPRLETKTFALHHLRASEAADLIRPYIYTEREGAPGMVSEAQKGSSGITVRETADNLDRIAAVLAEFDRAGDSTDPTTLTLKFQLITANGSEPDPRIVDVVTELQRFLRFDGYSLAGETFVSVAGRGFEQRIRTEEAIYHIDGDHDFGDQKLWIRLSTVDVLESEARSFPFETMGPTVLETTVAIQPGKTLVLGTVTGDEETAILVVRSLVTDQVDTDPAEVVDAG